MSMKLVDYYSVIFRIKIYYNSKVSNENKINRDFYDHLKIYALIFIYHIRNNNIIN